MMLLCVFPPFGIGVVVYEISLKLGLSQLDALGAGFAVVLSFIAMLILLLIAIDEAASRNRE